MEFQKFQENKELVVNTSGISHFGENNSVTCRDGVKYEDIDLVMYGTGYKYAFPFLDEDDDIVQVRTDGRYFGPLYLHMFAVDHPEVMFIGLP